MIRNRNKLDIVKMVVIITSGLSFLFGTDILLHLGYTGSLIFEMEIISFGFFMGSAIIYTLEVANSEYPTAKSKLTKAVYTLLSIFIGMLMGASAIWMSTRSSGVIAFVVLLFSIIIGISVTVTLITKTVI